MKPRRPTRGPYGPAAPSARDVAAAMRLFAPLTPIAAVSDRTGLVMVNTTPPVHEAGVFTCEVPLPPAELSPNARVHFRTRATAVLAYQRDVHLAVHAAYPGRGWPVFAGKVALTLTFIYPTERRIDLDNCAASFKAGLDALVNMGVLRDDGHKVIDSITTTRRTERGVTARVVVEIRGVGL